VVDSDWSIYQPPFAHEESGKQIERKYFYSEQAAKEYVLKNKPCLSVNDVWEIYSNGETNNFYTDSENFAKQKINSI
jgi:hypothetical protein